MSVLVLLPILRSRLFNARSTRQSQFIGCHHLIISKSPCFKLDFLQIARLKAFQYQSIFAWWRFHSISVTF